MEVDGVDAVVRAVRYHAKRKVNSMKVMMSAGVATAGANGQVAQFSPEETRAAVAEAHKYGMKVFTHSIGYEAIRNGVEAGVDSIDHGYWLDEELAENMRDRGTYLVPTFGPFHYYTVVRKAEAWRIARAEPVAPRLPAVFQLAMEIGVPIAMGSDCGAPSRYPNGENALELELMVKSGMKPEQALKVGTSEAAKLIGLSSDVGSLEAGKYADLIVVDGNPLDDIRVLRSSVKLVMKGGQVHRDDLGTSPSPLGSRTHQAGRDRSSVEDRLTGTLGGWHGVDGLGSSWHRISRPGAYGASPGWCHKHQARGGLQS